MRLHTSRTPGSIQFQFSPNTDKEIIMTIYTVDPGATSSGLTLNPGDEVFVAPESSAPRPTIAGWI